MKNKLLPGLAFLLVGMALCGAGLWLLLCPPQYAATARVNMSTDDMDSAVVSFSGYFPQVSTEIMQSELVLSNVVAGLNLKVVWGKKHSNGEPLKYAECNAIIRNHLRFKLIRNTTWIDITYFSADPKEAADVANAIVKGYNEYRIISRKEMAAKGVEVMQQQYQDEEKHISLQQTNGEQMLRLHKLLAEKIEAMKGCMPYPPNMPYPKIVTPAKPPQFSDSTNRPLGAALLAAGLFPLLGGILLLKSKP